jgi:hypothetical protein
VGSRIMLLVGLAVGGAALLAGLDYYLVPLAERPFSPMHAQFAPTGLVGQGLGIVGTGMMALGVLSYGVRKRVRALARLGKLRDWLRVHIFLCLLGPFLVLLHTSFKIGGLVAIAFWSMTLVVASGVFGRWVYVWIPKTANGRFLTREEMRGEIRELLGEIDHELGTTPDELMKRIDERIDGLRRPAHNGMNDRRRTPRPGPDRRRRTRHRSGILGAILESFAHALGGHFRRARIARALAELGVPQTARPRVVESIERQRRIELQLRMLEPFQAAFRYWHAFHLPLAVVMVLVLLVHVGVAIAFGYTWIWSS